MAKQPPLLQSIGFAIVGVLFFTPYAAAQPAGNTEGRAPPSAVVRRFDQALLATMKAGQAAGMSGRYAIMHKAVRTSFDLSFIGKLVLGHYWKMFSPAQRQAFTDLFAKLVAATYAYNFDGYNGQEFKIERDAERGANAFVYTEFFIPGHGHRHSFDYVLHKDQNRWLIVNVVADGVSDMAIKREEYQNALRHGSYDSLIARMRREYSLLQKKGR
jgi:phospholipid transport system substrate-binding protein